jgi:predicted dehydrogenase
VAPRRPTVALWGAGMIATVHAEACRSIGWQVRAVASRSPDRAADLAAAVGARATTFDDLVATRIADVAIVATPPSAHVDDAIRLLDAGYHVVVEAPLACTLEAADRLLAAEQRVARPVLYSEHLVAAPVIDALLDDVGSLGHLTHLSARALQPPPHWRATSTAEWGGGALFDLGVHPIGLVLRAAAEAGAGPADELTAVITDAGSDHEHGTVRLHFASGLSATIVVGWQPDRAPDWDLQASSATGVLRAQLYPSPTLERNGDEVATPGSTGGEVSLVDDYGYASQLTRYWATVRTGRPVPATSSLGRRVLEVVAAAHRSAGHDAELVALPFAGRADRTPQELLVE